MEVYNDKKETKPCKRGIDVDDHKDVLGFWLSKDESSRQWIQILEEIKRLRSAALAI